MCYACRPKTFEEQTVALSAQDKQTLEQNMASYTVFPMVVCRETMACYFIWEHGFARITNDSASLRTQGNFLQIVIC